MAKGRRPLPAEVKAAKGNPGKRRLHVMKDEAGGAVQRPDFVTSAAEKRYFDFVVHEIAQKFVRPSDAFSVGRYAYYLARWAKLKRLSKDEDDYYETSSPHSEKLIRKHPAVEILLKMEIALLRLEDRLGLNPAARQTIIRGLMMAPIQGALPLGDQAPAPGAEGESPVTLADADALGFLTQASNAKH